MALNTHLDGHLKKVLGTANYTVTGAQSTNATVQGNLSNAQLRELIDSVAPNTKFDVTLVAGVLTFTAV
jgi:hypothetical protein